MKWFLVSMAAFKIVGNSLGRHHSATILTAPSESEAEQKALLTLKTMKLPSDGWVSHDAVATEISEGTLKEIREAYDGRHD